MPVNRSPQETKWNYTDDYCLFFDFLWGREKAWCDATADDLWDFEDWRTRSLRNPCRVGGARWNRGLAALIRLYEWAVQRDHVTVNPVIMRSVLDRSGQRVLVPAARAKNARTSEVRWLTPRAFRRWVEVGLRGYGADGMPSAGWTGRLADRNSAFADLLFSSGIRLTEGASLLTLEVPRLRLEGGRYYVGRLARAVTKSKRARTFYASSVVVGEIEGYVESSRARAVRRAQALGRYDDLPTRLVTHETGRHRRVLHWRDWDGVVGQTPLTEATVEERMSFFTEGPAGPEPLWLWLNESGLPFHPASWENVFRAANERCEAMLSSVMSDPPFCTPHMCRHGFALLTLVVLNHVMDRRMGLTPEERRDFRLLYGDPWRMVQDLLGHAQLETTKAVYLAPVADLQLRSLLADFVPADGPVSEQELAGLFTRLARESEGIQDAGGPVSRRGRAVALPDGPHQRPAVLEEDSLVVQHRDAQSRVRSYNFGALPVPEAFQRSLAALYATKCAPGGGWDSIETSEAHWYLVRPLADLAQEHIDDWIAGATSQRRYLIRYFLKWTTSRQLTRELTVPSIPKQEPQNLLDEDDRWPLLQRCLTDEALPTDVRAAGAITLLFGPSTERLCHLTPEHLKFGDKHAHLVMGRHSVLLPPRLAELLRCLAEQPQLRPQLSRVRPGPRWLFPGMVPGKPISTHGMTQKLGRHGIPVRTARNGALAALAADLPSPILADVTGMHRHTALRWVAYARRDWAEYLAARAADYEEAPPL